MSWKYTDNTNQVVFRINPDGSMESCLASVLPEGTEILPADPIVPPKVASVTMRQARLQLLAIGKLDDVEAAIATMGPAAQITWEFSSVVERNNALVAPMQVLLGYTDEQMDTLFQEASML